MRLNSGCFEENSLCDSVALSPNEVTVEAVLPFSDYEPLAAVFRDTLLKTLLAFVPRLVMAVMHTTTIRASMTAY